MYICTIDITKSAAILIAISTSTTVKPRSVIAVLRRLLIIVVSSYFLRQRHLLFLAGNRAYNAGKAGSYTDFHSRSVPDKYTEKMLESERYWSLR